MPAPRTAARLAAAALVPLLAGCGRGEPVTETPPRQISESPFEYPEEMWDAQVEGRTVLRILIDEAGAVDSVRVETPSGYTVFDSAAVEGARRLSFEPARRGDEPVAQWFLLPVEFSLAPGDTAAADTATEPTP